MLYLLIRFSLQRAKFSQKNIITQFSFIYMSSDALFSFLILLSHFFNHFNHDFSQNNELLIFK